MDTTTPHVLIFPLPVQGSIKSMLMLAELLCHDGVYVTFLNTEHNHRRLFRENTTHHHHFRFATISDGIPDDNPRTGDFINDLFKGLENVTKPLFRQMLCFGSLSAGSEKPLTTVVVEGVMGFAIDVAEEAGIPVLYFDTFSPSGLWACFCVPRLMDAGEIPFEAKDLDAPIKSIPGMEDILRCRDLPGFCRAADMTDHDMRNAIKSMQRIPRGRGIILNTFEELDLSILTHMQSLKSKIYPIGPLHKHLKSKLKSVSTTKNLIYGSSSLWEEDKSCITWLDSQPQKSVIYVSIGSAAVMTKDQVVEFWNGLVNSEKRFLWVQRPNSVSRGDFFDEISLDILEKTKQRGFIVSWSPQEEVLAHSAIGGFLTHSGWNSTLESITEGVPMLCWPYFFDQQVNSRFVSTVWKVGIDMKDICDRVIIEKMIRDLMNKRNDKFLQHSNAWAKIAAESVNEGGSSALHFTRLVKDIKLMSR